MWNVFKYFGLSLLVACIFYVEECSTEYETGNWPGHEISKPTGIIGSILKTVFTVSPEEKGGVQDCFRKRWNRLSASIIPSVMQLEIEKMESESSSQQKFGAVISVPYVKVSVNTTKSNFPISIFDFEKHFKSFLTTVKVFNLKCIYEPNSASFKDEEDHCDGPNEGLERWFKNFPVKGSCSKEQWKKISFTIDGKKSSHPIQTVSLIDWRLEDNVLTSNFVFLSSYGNDTRNILSVKTQLKDSEGGGIHCDCSWNIPLLNAFSKLEIKSVTVSPIENELSAVIVGQDGTEAAKYKQYKWASEGGNSLEEIPNYDHEDEMAEEIRREAMQSIFFRNISKVKKNNKRHFDFRHSLESKAFNFTANQTKDTWSTGETEEWIYQEFKVPAWPNFGHKITQLTMGNKNGGWETVLMKFPWVHVSVQATFDNHRYNNKTVLFDYNLVDTPLVLKWIKYKYEKQNYFTSLRFTAPKYVWDFDFSLKAENSDGIYTITITGKRSDIWTRFEEENSILEIFARVHSKTEEIYLTTFHHKAGEKFLKDFGNSLRKVYENYMAGVEKLLEIIFGESWMEFSATTCGPAREAGKACFGAEELVSSLKYLGNLIVDHKQNKIIFYIIKASFEVLKLDENSYRCRLLINNVMDIINAVSQQYMRQLWAKAGNAEEQKAIVGIFTYFFPTFGLTI